MSIEFFRTEDQRPLDADGFELPPWENPYFAIPPDDDQVEPTAADQAWLASWPAPANSRRVATHLSDR